MENNKMTDTQINDLFQESGNEIFDVVTRTMEKLEAGKVPPSAGVQFLCTMTELLMTNMMAFVKEGEKEEFLMKIQLEIFRNVLGNVSINKSGPSNIILQ